MTFRSLLPPFNRLAYAALLGFGLWGLLRTAPADTPLLIQGLMALLLYGPLLIFLPAVLRSDRRQLAWMCFALMFYFCAFVARYDDPAIGLPLTAARILATVTLFTTAMLVIRSRHHD